MYDEQGQLIGEYDEAGTAKQETVWLGNLPVATHQNGQTYAVHSDHLGTPRVITDGSYTEVWRWDSDPFGTSPANEDPDGDGAALTYNLRFPGQYYDQETGLHYNYFRDYDPSTGRYIEPDPIGALIYQDIALRNLLGNKQVMSAMSGVLMSLTPEYNHLYAYVQGNPLLLQDIYGLKDFLDDCVGRYKSCGVTQDPDASTVGNYLRYKVCEKSIDSTCQRTGNACCEMDKQHCYAMAAGDEAETAKCTMNYMKCIKDAGK
jgi:RHS repeat-associated protein